MVTCVYSRGLIIQFGFTNARSETEGEPVDLAGAMFHPVAPLAVLFVKSL